MNTIYVEIIQYLLDRDETVTSASLASHFSVSPRSIKSYIKTINESGKNKNIITSSNKGYRINSKEAIIFLSSLKSQKEDMLPQNYDERIHHIIKRLIINNESINLFDLTQEIYTSYSTLKSDITRFNREHTANKIEILLNHDMITISGDEYRIRKLLSKVIFDEIPNKLMTVDILLDNFPKIYVDNVLDILNPLLQENNIRINEFAFMNLVLHLIVLVNSAKHRRVSKSSSSNNILTTPNDLIENLSLKTAEKIESAFSITLTDWDLNQINLLFQANINFVPTNQLKLLEPQIPNDIITSFYNAISKVETYYNIRLDSEQFKFNFVIHLNNLNTRARNNSNIKNPMKSLLKKNFPIVFDIAVFVSINVSKDLGIEIIDDEVAYIALHIGNEIENQKLNRKKIAAAILCSDYMSIGQKLYLDIKNSFENLNLVLLTLDVSEIYDYDVDLIITTIPLEMSQLNNNESIEVVRIAPFLDHSQKLNISNTIDKIDSNKKRDVLISNFGNFFSESLFVIDNNYSNRNDVLKFMCDGLTEQGVVNSDFLQRVLDRDNASSTAFGQIAIPHSQYMDAFTTKVSVLISPTGILWDDKIVHLIFLAAINFNDRGNFPQVYEGLISLFDSSDNLTRLLNVQSYDEFKIFVQNNAF